MKLHQLSCPAATQSAHSITAAAEKLHKSQPGVSKRIKLPEDELRFRRDGLLRKDQLDFMQLLAPQLTRRVIERAVGAATRADLPELTGGRKLPLR